MKLCSKCREPGQFRSCNSSSDGFKSQCRRCENSAKRAARAAKAATRVSMPLGYGGVGQGWHVVEPPPRVYDNRRILAISDMHAPYEHPDTVPFLYDVKQKYEPTRVVCVGDEVDKHAMSFHDADPDLPSAGDELELAIKALTPLYKMFPEMDLVDSNHGSMVYRKGKHHGIPRKYLRDYGDILEAPTGWKWHKDLLIEMPTGQDLYIHHGLKKNGITLATSQGCCVIQGHFHTEFTIQYASNPRQLLWSMQVGCSIDDKTLAFHYNKTTAARPIIGHGIVIDGIPKLLPMVLDRHGRWTGVTP